MLDVRLASRCEHRLALSLMRARPVAEFFFVRLRIGDEADEVDASAYVDSFSMA